MNLLLCDFCGDEMRVPAERYAAMTVIETIEAPAEFRIFPVNPATIRQTQHLMCAACLAHLLPIADRVRREKQPERRPVDGVIATELRPLFINGVRVP